MIRTTLKTTISKKIHDSCNHVELVALLKKEGFIDSPDHQIKQYTNKGNLETTFEQHFEHDPEAKETKPPEEGLTFNQIFDPFDEEEPETLNIRQTEPPPEEPKAERVWGHPVAGVNISGVNISKHSPHDYSGPDRTFL